MYVFLYRYMYVFVLMYVVGFTSNKLMHYTIGKGEWGFFFFLPDNIFHVTFREHPM